MTTIQPVRLDQAMQETLAEMLAGASAAYDKALERAEKARIADRADAPKPVCPTCFTQLPANGVCWQCD